MKSAMFEKRLTVGIFAERKEGIQDQTSPNNPLQQPGRALRLAEVCRLSCSSQGGHYGLPRYVVSPARPAAELCRSASEGKGDEDADAA
jgi:hypothetical protein